MLTKMPLHHFRSVMTKMPLSMSSKKSIPHRRFSIYTKLILSGPELSREDSVEFSPGNIMAYVERGVVKSKQSFWRLKTITDFFSMIINFVQVFFLTMFSTEKSDAYKKGSGSSKKWGGGGPGGSGGGRGPYGGGPSRGLDNVRGLKDIHNANHSSLPACGSCCGG